MYISNSFRLRTNSLVQSTFKADVTTEEWLLIKGLKPVRYSPPPYFTWCLEAHFLVCTETWYTIKGLSSDWYGLYLSSRFSPLQCITRSKPVNFSSEGKKRDDENVGVFYVSHFHHHIYKRTTNDGDDKLIPSKRHKYTFMYIMIMITPFLFTSISLPNGNSYSRMA